MREAAVALNIGEWSVMEKRGSESGMGWTVRRKGQGA